MGSPASSLGPMLIAALQQRQGQSAQPGGGMPPGVGGTPAGEGAASDYAQQVSSLKGADPGNMVRQLKALKQILAIMAVQNLERLPNVSGQIFKVIPSFDRIIKEAMQASNVAGAVRNPIQMSAAQPPADSMGGQNPQVGMTGGGGMGGGPVIPGGM